MGRDIDSRIEGRTQVDAKAHVGRERRSAVVDDLDTRARVLRSAMASPLRGGAPADVEVAMAFVVDGRAEAEPQNDAPWLRTVDIVKLIAADCLPNQLGVFCARGMLRGRANYFPLRRDWAGKEGPLVLSLARETQDTASPLDQAECERELFLALSQVRLWMCNARTKAEELSVPGEIEPMFRVVVFLHSATWSLLSRLREFCDTFRREGVVVHVVSMGGDDGELLHVKSDGREARPFVDEMLADLHLHSLGSQDTECIVSSSILRKDGVTLLDSWIKNYEEIPPGDVKVFFDQYERSLSTQGNRARARSGSSPKASAGESLSSQYAAFHGYEASTSSIDYMDISSDALPTSTKPGVSRRAAAASMFCSDQSRMIGSGQRYLRKLLMTDRGDVKINAHHIGKLRKAVTEPIVQIKVGKLLPVYGRNPGHLEKPPTLRPDTRSRGILKLSFLTMEKLQLTWSPTDNNLHSRPGDDHYLETDTNEHIASIPCSEGKRSGHVQVELIEEDPSGLSFCIKAGKGAGTARKFFWFQEPKSSGLQKLEQLRQEICQPRSLPVYSGLPKSEILLIVSILPILQASSRAQQTREPHPNLLPLQQQSSSNGKHPQHSGIPLAEDVSEYLEEGMEKLDLTGDGSNCKREGLECCYDAEQFDAMAFLSNTAVEPVDLGMLAVGAHSDSAKEESSSSAGLGDPSSSSSNEKRDGKVTVDNLYSYMKDKNA